MKTNKLASEPKTKLVDDKNEGAETKTNTSKTNITREPKHEAKVGCGDHERQREITGGNERQRETAGDSGS